MSDTHDKLNAAQHVVEDGLTYQCLKCRYVFNPQKGAVELKCPYCGGVTLQLLKAKKTMHEDGAKGPKRILKG